MNAEAERHARYRAEVADILDQLDVLLADREGDAVAHDMVEDWTALRDKTGEVRETLAAGDVPAAHRAAKGAKISGRRLELTLHSLTDRTGAKGGSGIGRFFSDLGDLFRIFG